MVAMIPTALPHINKNVCHLLIRCSLLILFTDLSEPYELNQPEGSSLPDAALCKLRASVL